MVRSESNSPDILHRIEKYIAQKNFPPVLIVYSSGGKDFLFVRNLNIGDLSGTSPEALSFYLKLIDIDPRGKQTLKVRVNGSVGRGKIDYGSAQEIGIEEVMRLSDPYTLQTQILPHFPEYSFELPDKNPK